jgi:hypothetical protein
VTSEKEKEVRELVALWRRLHKERPDSDDYDHESRALMLAEIDRLRARVTELEAPRAAVSKIHGSMQADIGQLISDLVHERISLTDAAAMMRRIADSYDGQSAFSDIMSAARKVVVTAMPSQMKGWTALRELKQTLAHYGY